MQEREADRLAPAHAVVAAQKFEEIEVSLDPASKTYWCHLNPTGRPSVTPGLVRDVRAMQRSIGGLFEGRVEAPVQYFVVGSRTPGIFNLGGDLTLFAQLIRRGDRDALRAYAYQCVEIVHQNWTGYGKSIVTIALVEGDALGGGFETALSCNVIVAERGAKLGLPEVIFNLFPGMGAYSFLSRRLGPHQAHEMILGGETYSAEQLHAIGLVQVLADPGRGREAVEEFIARNRRRHNAQSALLKAGRVVNPISMEELQNIADVWVEAALVLTESDLRRMERIVAAQQRRREGSTALAG